MMNTLCKMVDLPKRSELETIQEYNLFVKFRLHTVYVFVYVYL